MILSKYMQWLINIHEQEPKQRVQIIKVRLHLHDAQCRWMLLMEEQTRFDGELMKTSSNHLCLERTTKKDFNWSFLVKEKDSTDPRKQGQNKISVVQHSALHW